MAFRSRFVLVSIILVVFLKQFYITHNFLRLAQLGGIVAISRIQTNPFKVCSIVLRKADHYKIEPPYDHTLLARQMILPKLYNNNIIHTTPQFIICYISY